MRFFFEKKVTIGRYEDCQGACSLLYCRRFRLHSLLRKKTAIYCRRLCITEAEKASQLRDVARKYGQLRR